MKAYWSFIWPLATVSFFGTILLGVLFMLPVGVGMLLRPALRPLTHLGIDTDKLYAWSLGMLLTVWGIYLLAASAAGICVFTSYHLDRPHSFSSWIYWVSAFIAYQQPICFAISQSDQTDQRVKTAAPMLLLFSFAAFGFSFLYPDRARLVIPLLSP